MAPVTSSSTGVAGQIIDDPELKALIQRLSLLAPDPTGITNAAAGGETETQQQQEPPPRITDETVTALVSELTRWPKWRFQEQADLYQWIKPLDAIDAALTHLLDNNPHLLLIGREPSKSIGSSTSPPTGGSRSNSSSTTEIQQAESAQDVSSVPAAVTESVRTILRFLSELLRNSYNKMVFNSVTELSDLLAAADEDVAALALEGLSRLSTPHMLHRQQQPEMTAFSTGIHMSPPSSAIHGRLLTLAKGWGSRGTGLGLYTCVVTDDTASGRSILPTIPGEVSFECYLDDVEGSGSPPSTSASGAGAGANVASHLVSVKMSTEDMLSSPPPEQRSPSRQVEKRRRTGSRSDDSTIRHSSVHQIDVKSTGEIFFSCLDNIGGRSVLPPETLFALLAEIRLARAYQTRAGRIAAVKRRLLAIVAILQSHPSQDVLVGYFHAQPELCAELCDLVRPILSPTTAARTADTSASPRSSSRNDTSSGIGSSSGGSVPSRGHHDAITALSDDASAVPYEIQMLAMEALTALVARRDGTSGGLSNIARTVNAFGELGVAKGQFFGLLPALIRFTLSSLNAFLSQSGAAYDAPGAEAGIAGNGMKGKEEEEGGKLGGSRAISEPEPMITDEMSTGETAGGGSPQPFVEATSKASPLPRRQQEERLLEFIDVVLTLTSTVISIPIGTSALTDCGLIPALIQTVSRDFEAAQSVRKGNAKSPFTNPGDKEGRGTAYADGLLKFVSAQAVQILEAAIVTHNSALVAFHELEGVDLLVKRLDFEIDQIKQSGNETPSSVGIEGDVEMEDAKSQDGNKDGSIDSSSSASARPLSASRRVLLFSLMNCLTVVFHQQENSSSASITSTSAAQLRKPELTNVIIDILGYVDGYGGVLGSLVGTLLSDVMNSDPQVVHYVHTSGIADAFFKMVKGEVTECSPLLGSSSPILPASAELIMAVPNVLSALALTEQGARDVKNANPFPALLDIFCSPKYVMPSSRCLLNEVGAIVGTGLDEIMRHVPSLGGIVNNAIVDTLSRIVSFGKEVVEKEKARDVPVDGAPPSREIEGLRTCLVQYAYNISQLLEQVLHHESHCGSFVDRGGLDALLELFPLLIPGGTQFLSHASCLGAPSFAKLSHLTNSGAITAVIRSISSNISSHKMIKKLTECLEKQVETLRISQGELWRQTRKAREERTGSSVAEGDVDETCGSINGILDGVPRVPLHTLEDSASNLATTDALSNFLRQFVVTEWLTNLLTSSMRVALQKSSEIGTGWGRTEREWKKLLSSKQFEDLVDELSNLHRCSMQEVCRVRTEEGYDQRESDRCCPPGTPGNNSHPALYRIRIVCPDGAVVRDGIEIDSSESVGGLEIGEIVEATERCINSSGVLRYRTRSGWVSEQTRGHGREPIAEVMEIQGLAPQNLSSGANVDDSKDSADGKGKRVECGVTDLCSMSAAIMARIQHSRTGLFAYLSRSAVSSARSLQFGSISFLEGSVGAHISSIIRILSRNIRDDFAIEGAVEAMAIALSEDMRTNANESAASAHITMYFGCMLGLLHASVFEEKREREVFNVLLLFSLLNEAGILLDFRESKASCDPGSDADLPSDGFIGAIRFVLSEGLSDMQRRALSSADSTSPEQKLSRYTAASFPPALALLRRLVSRSILTESGTNFSLAQMPPADLDKLVGGQGQIERSFHTGRFCRSLYTCVANISVEMWGDSRLANAPAHVIHPTLNLLADTMSSLKRSTQSSANTSSGASSRSRGARGDGAGVGGGGGGSGLFARRLRARRPPFEPSEDTITRLAEMGFDRDHALEALETMESNRLEVAMEYCLSHPPPSPASAERRRAAREAASASRRSREADAEASGGNDSSNNNDANRDTSNDAESSSSDGGAAGAAAAAAGAASSQAGAAVESASNDTATAAAAPSAAAANSSPANREAADGESSMDVDDAAEKDNKEITEEERKEHQEKMLNEASRDRTKKCLDLMIDQVISGALRIIEGRRTEVDKTQASLMEGSNDVATRSAIVEDENAVLVVCLFLLDLCKDSPSQRSTLILETLKRLKSNIAVNGKRTMVAEGKERVVASLCHAAVVFLRALPRTRSIALEEGLVGCIMSCLRSATKGGGEPMTSGWPRWFAPFILFLDVMAQPIAFSIDGDKTKSKEEVSREFTRFCEYQKKQSAALSKATYQVFSILKAPDGRDGKKSDKKQSVAPSTPAAAPSPATTTSGDAKAENDDKGENAEKATGEGKRASGSSEQASSVISPIPCYTPMILPDAAEACMQMCLQILRRCSSSSSSSDRKSLPSSDVVQAVLLLLSRVVRSHKVASQCLKSGGAELICSLPKECRFNGNTEAMTMVLRRLLEDSTTLQTLMETEIRATLAKQARQPRGTSRNAVGTKVPLKTFLQQMTSLICRDPLVFLRAAAISVKIDVDSSSVRNGQAQVELLSAEVRAKNAKLLADRLGGSSTGKSGQSDRERRQSLPSTTYGSAPKRGRAASKSKSPHASKACKSKSPHRSSGSRRSLSPKKDGFQRKQITLNGTPANHVTALLFTEMIKAFEHKSSKNSVCNRAGGAFLSTVEYLEILADLVLAIPACAAAIHRYRPSAVKITSSKKYIISHALPGCPSPQNSAVNFLLHVLLPLPRPSLRKEPTETDLPENVVAVKAQRKAMYENIRLVQTSARLLVALVARAGEGRKRVIVELAYAMNGGGVSSPAVSTGTSGSSSDGRQMWALQSWGDLCIGLAAPRSSGVSQDGNSTLSFEVVRLMLESGMAHAVMHAIGQVKLYHPLASATAASLLRPLEIFSRVSVTDVVEKMIKDEEEKKKKKASSTSTAKDRGSSDASLHEDAMIEDGFHADAAPPRFGVDGDGVSSDDGWEEENSSDESDSTNMDDVDEDNESVSDSMDRDTDDEDMMDEESDSMDRDSDEGSESVSDSERDSDGDDDDDEEIDGEVLSDEMDQDAIEDTAFFAAQGDADVEIGLPQPGDLDADWTLLGEDAENPLLQALPPGGPGGIGMALAAGLGEEGLAFPPAARVGSTVGDSATLENMIGSILRAGEIPLGSSLDDLEATLGIRLSNQLESLGRIAGIPLPRGGGGGGGDGGTGDGNNLAQADSDQSLRSTDRGAVGSIPAVLQTIPPDIGYSLINPTGRSENFNAMEYMYGGPVVSAGRAGRFYNTTSSSSTAVDIESSEETHIPASVSTLLFPGGPVASTHVRRRQLPHPLLRDVELGPINALVPSTDRRRGADRRSRAEASSGFGGGRFVSNIIVSDGNGNIIRQSNPRRLGDPSRASASSGGVFGWTEDDRAPDMGLSDEFEIAFREVMSQATAPLPPNPPAETDENGEGSAQPPNNEAGSNEAGPDEAATDSADQDETMEQNSENDADVDAAGDGPASDNAPEAPAAAGVSSGGDTGPGGNVAEDASPAVAAVPAQNQVENAVESGGSVSEGENVASSLASGLRLSSSRESPHAPRLEPATENTQQQESTQNISREDAEMQDATVNGNANVESASQHDGSGEPGDSNETSQADSAAAAGDSTAEDAGNANDESGEENSTAAAAAAVAAASSSETSRGNAPNDFGLVCPPGMDLEVFNSLPHEMQQEVVAQHQSAENVAGELDATSGLDPEALAALPEEMRREVIEQERQERERREREEAPADISNAQEMDNASFLVSLAPELREEVLLTADDAFLNSLPQHIIAEAQVLRERRAFGMRREQQPAPAPAAPGNARSSTGAGTSAHAPAGVPSSRKKQRLGRMKVECDRDSIIFVPKNIQEKDGPVVTAAAMKSVVRLLFLLSPIRPHRVLQKVLQNFCSNGQLRQSMLSSFVALLNGDRAKARAAVNALDSSSTVTLKEPRQHELQVHQEEFPPFGLIGTAPAMEFESSSSSPGPILSRQRNSSNAAAAIAGNIPMSSRALSGNGLPPILAKRVIDTCIHLAKHVPRMNLDALFSDDGTKMGASPSCALDQLLDLLGKQLYLKSPTILEHLLCMIEGVCSPLSLVPKEGEEPPKLTQTEIEAATSTMKEWIEVPRPVVTPYRLKLLCSLLKLEYVKDSSFTRVNTIARRLCRVEENRHFILRELSGVAGVLAEGATKDLQELSARLREQVGRMNAAAAKEGRIRSSVQVSLASSTTESKLLRVLQALSALSGESQTDVKKIDGLPVASPELVSLMESISLDALWSELTSCLRLVSILEGVELKEDSDKDEKDDGGDTDGGEGSALEDGSRHSGEGQEDGAADSGRKLQNSAAGVLTRFLPSIEAFFVVNGVARKQPKTRSEVKGEAEGDAASVVKSSAAESKPAVEDRETEPEREIVLGGMNLVDFVSSNRVLLNALIRSNPSLLDKGLRAMVTVPGCRPFLDFDVKRQWFRTCIRRLRQHASRRHGSLRLHIRRKHVFEDAYHQLQVRNAEEMRGRLHVTFTNEEGVDAGGLSREFFAILAKEMFNPNYALFTSTEDGCTFQPNPNSSINHDHLHYFRFVGRIVGKAISDGYLLDAHFTRSLYKHMLGVKPTHHDMEAIDPDYYKNLKLILEHNLDDIGLELTFSIEHHSFGGLQTIDLIPNGRNIKVTEESKEKYVSLVCQHRMTTSIESQIKAFLEGFNEMIKPELISIFTAKELELLISGLPDIDVFDLKKNTDYQGYRPTDKEVEWFWNVMTSLTRSQKAAFLQFVTGSSKVPLNGFSELQGMRGVQKFSIHKVGGSSGALMSAHTCFNSLDLPVYKSEEELKEKLLYAISEGAGGFMFA